MSREAGSVDIGFIDECEAWKLESRFFPSKVGGRPAWLDLSNLPMPSDLQCKKCKVPCKFLCQVYAPIETRDDCFHRTLFVFICGSSECCAQNDNTSFLVLRCQLSRENSFYPFEPPIESGVWHPEVKAEKWSDLCIMCGCRGPSHCGRCKKVKYCGRNHQVVHWRESHKNQCGKDSQGNCEEIPFPFLLPEFELLTEPEMSGVNLSSNDSSGDESGSDEDEETRLKYFKELHKEGKTGIFSEDERVDADLLSMAASKEDTAFITFKTRISQSPEQVLRYERGGAPLWISDHHVPSLQDIEPCPHCGSKRIFEFQILPQLLNHLSLDVVDKSIDWGVLAVFTCEKSCNEGPAYKAEFLWKQDVST